MATFRFTVLASALIVASSALPFGASAQTANPTGITKVCSARAAARVFADSLAARIRDFYAPDLSLGKISKPSVRVVFSGAKTRPAKTTADFAKDVTFSINPSATTGKFTVQGDPAPETLYGLCDGGRTQFTVLIKYNIINGTTKTPVVIRDTFERTIPGQYL